MSGLRSNLCLSSEEWVQIVPEAQGGEPDAASHITPILDRLTDDKRFAYMVTQTGNDSSYYEVLIFESASKPSPEGEARDVPCVLVQLNLNVFLGIFGPATFSIGSDYFSLESLRLERVANPASPADQIQQAIVAAIHDCSPYRLIGREILERPLPADVEIYEYCLSLKPWDRVFHGLFSRWD